MGYNSFDQVIDDTLYIQIITVQMYVFRSVIIFDILTWIDTT